MYIEVSYGITGEVYSTYDYNALFPYRIAFSSQEEIEKWCGEMDAKYGEHGWRLGDENVHQCAAPRWPLWTERPWAHFQSYKRAQ